MSEENEEVPDTEAEAKLKAEAEAKEKAEAAAKEKAEAAAKKKAEAKAAAVTKSCTIALCAAPCPSIWAAMILKIMCPLIVLSIFVNLRIMANLTVF